MKLLCEVTIGSACSSLSLHRDTAESIAESDLPASSDSIINDSSGVDSNDYGLSPSSSLRRGTKIPIQKRQGCHKVATMHPVTTLAQPCI